MTPYSQPAKSTAKRVQILIFLLANFAISFGITIGAHRVFGTTLDPQPTAAQIAKARADAIAAIPQLPKETEERLASALNPQLTPITATFSDPLVDRAGLDQKSHFSALPIASSSSALLPATPSIPAKLSRLTDWQQRVRAALTNKLIPPSITTAYLISELSPTGRLDIAGSQGAWFYIESEKRQIAANIGAKFYDGVLLSIDPDTNSGGAVFRTSDGQTKMVRWDRQDDFTNTAAAAQPAPRTIDQQQPQQPGPQTSPAPQTLVQPEAPVKTAIDTKPSREDYSDLQEAVRDRYPVKATTPPNTARLAPTEQPTQSSSNAQPFGSAVKSSAPNPVLRTNKLNFAHAANYFIRPNPVSYRAVHNATVTNILSLDISGSFIRRSSETALSTSEGQDSTNAQQVENRPITAPATPLDQTTTSSIQLPPQMLDREKRLGKESPPAPLSQPSQPVTTTTLSPAPAATPSPTPSSSAQRTLCDPLYRGENITITNESNRPLSLLNLVNRLNEAYNANIVLDYDVQETPVRLTVTNAPWTSILRTLLDLNDLDLVCLDGRIVQIAKRSKIASLDDLRRRSAPVIREVFRLRYLPQTAGGRANLAGQTQSSSGTSIQTLESAIRDILKAGNDPRGDARIVPGRNQLLVAAPPEQMEQIRDLIARVDRPGYQVKISALVYTANENRLRDVGSQLSLVVGNGAQTQLGGITTLPNSTSNSGNGGSGTGSGTGSGSNSGQPVAGLNPGGIPGLATGMRAPTNGLSASNPLATIGVTSLFGTAQFAYQLTLAQQKGLVNIQSRPFGIVADGDTFDLVAGTQIPVVTTTIAGGAPFQSGQVQFIEASRIARITPQVAEDETGNPNFVTLNIQLENNSVDTSLGTFNGVPGVNRQSLQTVLRLRNGETVVIGGLAADQVANAMAKVPGLSGVPLFGNLFKRKTNQENRDRLYFAITVEVISQNSPMPNFEAPPDAITTPPPPPRVQKPTPFTKQN